MTDKEKLDAIRAEIHRLVDVRGYDREMANDLFAFMDSLPNEPVSEDLEDAANKYIKGNYSPWLYKAMLDCFKAGAKWKENHFCKSVNNYDWLEYQLNLRLPETLYYNCVKVDRVDFIKDIIQQIKS